MFLKVSANETRNARRPRKKKRQGNGILLSAIHCSILKQTLTSSGDGTTT